MKNWIQNRSFLANLLTGGSAIIFSLGVLWYSVSAYYVREGDAADDVRWHTDNFKNELGILVHGFNQVIDAVEAGRVIAEIRRSGQQMSRVAGNLRRGVSRF